MTSNDALQRAELLRPHNQIDTQTKRQWLVDLDTRILEDVIMTHEGEERNRIYDFAGYLFGGGELIVPDLYSELYVWYLLSKIDSALGESEKYNISASRYNELYSDFRKWYNRTHKPYVKYGLKNTFKVGGLMQ